MTDIQKLGGKDRRFEEPTPCCRRQRDHGSMVFPVCKMSSRGSGMVRMQERNALGIRQLVQMNRALRRHTVLRAIVEGH